MVLIARRRSVQKLLRTNGPILIFLAYCGVSALWSEFPLVATKRWIKVLGDLVAVLIVVSDAQPITAIRKLFSRVGFLLIPVSILLIKYYPSLGRQYSVWTGEIENIGVTTQKNSLGFVCLIFGLGSWWRLIETFSSGERGRSAGPLIANGTVLALAFWLFWMSHSATSFACFLIGGCLMAVTGKRGVARKPAVLHLLVATVLFVVLYATLLNPEAGLLETVGRNSTLTGRSAIWQMALSVSSDPFLGAGYESFWLGERLKKISRLYGQTPPHAHNGYLEVFLNLGWAGVILLGFVMAWGYRNVIRALLRDPEAGRLRLAFFVVAAIYNLTEHAFRELHPVWIAFLLAVILIPEPLHQSSLKSATTTNRRKPVNGSQTLLATLGDPLAMYPFPRYRSDSAQRWNTEDR
jgi:O-antigen ligase